MNLRKSLKQQISISPLLHSCFQGNKLVKDYMKNMIFFFLELKKKVIKWIFKARCIGLKLL